MSDRGNADAHIAHLAARQHGHLTRQQLLDLGVQARTVTARVEVGKLVRVHAGVYALGYRRVEPVALAMAAVLAAGDGAVLSHDSAAALWDLRRWPRHPEVIAPGCVRRPRIKAHRSTTLTRADITTQLGVRTTTVARTLTDLRPRLSKKQFARLVNQARLDHRINEARATVLLGAPAPLTRSELERDFIAWIRRHGLWQPLTNTTLHGFEVDALFPEHKVIVELDDYGTHGDPVTFETDRERDAVHAEHEHITIRLTRERFNDAEAARLQRILDARVG